MKIEVDFDLEKALNKACIKVENAAKEKLTENNSVVTGQLRNSITHEVNGLEGTIGTNVEYAPYIEYGTGLFAEGGNGRTDVPWRYQDAEGNWHTTSGQEPKPFLRPALEESRKDILKALKEGLREDAKLKVVSRN